MNTAERILKNTLSLLFSGTLAQILSLSAMVYLARELGPAYFGKINFAAAITAYFTLAVHLGLPLLGTREIAKDRAKIKDYLRNILVLRLGLASISFAFLLLLLYFLNKPIDVKKLIFLYGVGLFISALIIDWVFQGVERMEFIGLGRILTSGTFMILVFAFVNGKGQLLYVPCFQVAGILIAAMMYMAVFLKNFGKPGSGIDRSFCGNLIRKSIPLGVSIIMIQVIYNIDTVMLGFMRSDEEIGYYNAAYKIIIPLIMVGSVYFDAIFPVLSNYYETSADALQKLQSFTANFMVTIALPLAGGGTLLAGPIMNFIYGHHYDGGVGAFRVLVWVVALIYLNMIYARGMWACDQQNAYLKIVIGQAVTNVMLNLFLIPRFGILGAAISTLCAEFGGFFFYCRGFNKIVRVSVLPHLFSPLIASVVMISFLLLAKNLDILVLMLLAIPIYICSLYMAKGITKKDLIALQSVLVLRKPQ